VGFISDRVRDHLQKRPLSFLVMGKTQDEGGAELVQNLVDEINVPVVIVP
jgi:hypothetical protein